MARFTSRRKSFRRRKPQRLAWLTYSYSENLVVSDSEGDRNARIDLTVSDEWVSNENLEQRATIVRVVHEGVITPHVQLTEPPTTQDVSIVCRDSVFWALRMGDVADSGSNPPFPVTNPESYLNSDTMKMGVHSIGYHYWRTGEGAEAPDLTVSSGYHASMEFRYDVTVKRKMEMDSMLYMDLQYWPDPSTVNANDYYARRASCTGVVRVLVRYP